MGRIFVNRAGLAVAGVLAAWHAIWAGLVAFGAAQPLVDFVYRIHFMQSAPTVGPFNPASAAMLILSAAVAGYAKGASLALAWNCLAGFRSIGTGSRPGAAARAGF